MLPIRQVSAKRDPSRSMEAYINLISTLPKRIANTFYGRLSRRIFFLHVPKCGGTSISAAFRSCYQTLYVWNDRFLPRHEASAAAKTAHILYGMDYLNGDINDYAYLEFGVAHLAYLMGQKRNMYISGHVCYDDRVYNQYSDTYDFITVLRDPVKRWISFYFYVKYRSANRMFTDLPIESYIKTEFGKSQGHEIVKLIGGMRKDNAYRTQEAIDTAKENLHKFSIVGCLEQLDELSERFQQIYGRNLIFTFRNQSPAKKLFKKNILSKEVINDITNICDPDIQVYNYLKKKVCSCSTDISLRQSESK